MAVGAQRAGGTWVTEAGNSGGETPVFLCKHQKTAHYSFVIDNTTDQGIRQKDLPQSSPDGKAVMFGTRSRPWVSIIMEPRKSHWEGLGKSNPHHLQAFNRTRALLSSILPRTSVGKTDQCEVAVAEGRVAGLLPWLPAAPFTTLSSPPPTPELC